MLENKQSFFFFEGGIETSRLTIRYLLLHMAAYPDIQTKVQEEIDTVVGECVVEIKPTLVI